MSGVQGVSSGMHGDILPVGRVHEIHKTIDEVEKERKDLITEKKKIELWLSDKNMTFDDGTTMDYKVYQDRRKEKN